MNRLTGIPYSFTAHGSDLHVERKMLDKKVENSAFTVTISEFNKNVILEDCGRQFRDKIEVVHCGVDPDEFKPDWKAKQSRPFQIICIASFEEVKGHIYLLQACQLLHKKDLNFECHLVGYGPLKKQMTRHVKQMGLEERIIIHAPKTRPEVIQMYAQSHVKVLPSVPTKQGKREGIPVVLMESMAMGLPAISSQLSGIPELVEDGRTGILVEPRDVKGIAAALERLYHDHELRLKMGKAGRKKVIEEFNLPQNAKQLSALFLAKFEPRNRASRSKAELAEV
ncbi:glycosyltransferase [bacterium]|nr:glycosyltransferase [bacterium]